MKKFPFLSLLVIASVCSCSNNKTLEYRSFFFDTFINSYLYEGEESNLKDINEILKDVNYLTDNYSNSLKINNVYFINEHNNERIEIKEDLYNVLKQSLKIKDQTNGLFNPLVGNLAKLWIDSLENDKKLQESIIIDELEKINNSSIVLEEENGSFFCTLEGEAKIDLGGIAKGFALDKCRDYFVSKDLNKYLIDAGSSSILLGEKLDNSKFKVGLKYIKNAYLELDNTFIGVSGVYEQEYKVENETFSHIINPINGDAKSNYDFTLVVGNNGALVDALSTSFMVMDIENIKKIVDFYGVFALIYKENSIIYKSEELEIRYH